jgi:hypothetical protein
MRFDTIPKLSADYKIIDERSVFLTMGIVLNNQILDYIE